jgi:hypothetical protein
LKITLQLCKANTLSKVEEREKKGEEKNYRMSFSVPWRPTRVAPPCRGGTMLWMPSQKATNGHQKTPHTLPKGRKRLPLVDACSAHTNYFLKKIIQRPKHPWSHEIIPRKPKLKNSKCPLILGKKQLTTGVMR